MTGAVGADAKSIDKVTVAGGIIGGRWNVAGVIGDISVGKSIDEWVLGDVLEPLSVFRVRVKGDISSSKLSADVFGAIKALSWMGGTLRTGSLGSLTLTRSLDMESVYADDVKRLSVGGDCSGAFSVNTLQKSVIRGSLFDATVQCRNSEGVSLATLKVSGWIRQTQIMARGDIGTVVAGA